MKNIFIIISLTFSNLFVAQKLSDSYNYIYAAEVFLKNKQYNKALLCFEKSFENKLTDNPDFLLDAAFCAFELGEDKKASVLLEKSVLFYRTPLEYLKTHDKLKKYISNKNYVRVIKDYENLYAKSFSNIQNIQNYFEIEELKTHDQFVRNLDQYHSGSKNQQYLDFKENVTDKTDSINAARLIEISKSLGYQKNSWLILWHHRLSFKQNDPFWNFFKPLLEKEISIGNVEPSFFTPFEDVVTSVFDKKQKYGTQKPYQFYPIEDINKIDFYRSQVGLPPLYYEYFIYGEKLPENYTLTYKEFEQKIMEKIKM